MRLLASAAAVSLCACVARVGDGSQPAGDHEVSVLSVTTSSLPAGTLGTSYAASLAVTGGTSPYTWSVSSGSLPDGLALASSGAISGTPAAAGSSSFTVRVTDAASATTTRALSISIGASSPVIPRMTLISRGAPAHASAGTASNGNSASYESAWEASSTAWLAYDLSGVPAAQRATVMVNWTVPNLQRYDSSWDAAPREPHSENGVVPGPYVIEGSSNSTDGGDGTWTTLFEDRSPQRWKSRTHLLPFSGYTWIRYRGTGNNPSFSSDPARTILHLDVHDAASTEDSWAMFGDSITGGAWRWSDLPVRVEGRIPGRFPLVQASGIAFMSTASALEDWWEWNGGDVITHAGTSWFDHWLSLFPGRRVVLAYGTNDTNGNFDAAQFRARFTLLIDKVLAAGQIPVIPSVIWNSTNDAYIQQANLVLGVRPGTPPAGSLKESYGDGVVCGPDLYGVFYGRTDLIEGDGTGLHPTGELDDVGSGTTSGYGVYRQAWADWAAGLY